MARAAAATDTLLVVPGNAGTTFRSLAETGATWWLQISVPSDRLVCRPLLDSAVAAGAAAVVLTADTPVMGTRYDRGRETVADIEKPDWLRANFPEGYGDHPGHELAVDLGPQDIDWLRKSTGLPVVVKGVLRASDARRCVDAGAAAVWVSNHGGRQLDRVAATADCLPAVVAAVGSSAEVYVDGGVRNGRHGLTALALGARGVFLGRSPLYALAVDGTDGVVRLVGSLVDELVESMRLCGCNRLHAVDEDLLAPS
jgi:4-hydroxymandelate oxidase